MTVSRDVRIQRGQYIAPVAHVASPGSKKGVHFEGVEVFEDEELAKKFKARLTQGGPGRGAAITKHTITSGAFIFNLYSVSSWCKIDPDSMRAGQIVRSDFQNEKCKEKPK